MLNLVSYHLKCFVRNFIDYWANKHLGFQLKNSHLALIFYWPGHNCYIPSDLLTMPIYHKLVSV